jgi:hypothetical protein
MRELTDGQLDPRWFEKVDIRGLSHEVRKTIIERVKGELGFNETVKALDISRGALHNYLHGLRRVPDEVISRALRYLEESEFHEIVGGIDRLRAVGLIRDGGSIDYSLASQVLKLASRDEYLRQLMLRFVVDNFKEELKKMLGLLPSTIKLT